MPIADHILNYLPDPFSRMDVKKQLHYMGFNPASSQHVLETLILDKDIKRVKRGIYTRT
jgi:hypothetical protein